MEQVKVTISTNDSTSSGQTTPPSGKPKVRKTKSKGKSTKKTSSKEASKSTTEESSFFKSALTFVTGGLYGSSSHKDEPKETPKMSSAKIEIGKSSSGLEETKPSKSKPKKPEKTDSEDVEYCEAIIKFQGDSLGGSSVTMEGTPSSPTPAGSMDSRQTSFPVLQRPSALLPRQNSGINAILDSSPESPEEAALLSDEVPPVTVSTPKKSKSIRTSYEQPKTLPPAAPLRLTNILHNRMHQGKAGEQGAGPRILNKAFFDSVHEHIKKIKSTVNTSVPSEALEDDEDEEEEMVEETTQRKGMIIPLPRYNSVPGPRDTASGNVNISLTVQLGQVDMKKGEVSEVGEISAANKNRTVIIDARKSNVRVETSMQTDTKSQSHIWQSSLEENMIITNRPLEDESGLESSSLPAQIEITPYESKEITEEDNSYGTFGKALEMTGDSLKTALNLVANIVPIDERQLTEEEMSASEGDIAITVMRLLGIPQELRHKIYQEACDEVEVLQDISAGTFEALSCIMKWVIGGSKGREDLRYKTRAICAMHSEVDMHSEVWHRLQKNVTDITDTVENVLQEGMERAQNASIQCSESLVGLVTSNTSAVISKDELTSQPELPKKVLGSIIEQDEVGPSVTNSYMDNHGIYICEDDSSTNSVPESLHQFDSVQPNPSFPQENYEGMPKPGSILEIAQNFIQSYDNSRGEFGETNVTNEDRAPAENHDQQDFNNFIEQFEEIQYENGASYESPKGYNDNASLVEEDARENIYQFSPDSFRQQLRNPAFFGPSDASLVSRGKAMEGEASEFHGDDIFVDQNGNYNFKKSEDKFNGEFDMNAYDDTNNNVPQEQTVGRFEIYSNVLKAFGGSNINLNSEEKFTDKPILDENNNFEYELPREKSVTLVASRSESVESHVSLSKFPRVPPNSELIFDTFKHEEKVLKDLNQLQKLVETLYKSVTPPASKTQIRWEDVECPVHKNEQSDYNEVLESNGNPDTSINNKFSVLASQAKTLASSKPTSYGGSRIPVPRKTPGGFVSFRSRSTLNRNPSGLTSKTPKSSTVSLYHSKKISESQKSVSAMDYPVGSYSRGTPSNCSQFDEDYSRSNISYPNDNLRSDSYQSIMSSPSSALHPVHTPSYRSRLRSLVSRPQTSGLTNTSSDIASLTPAASTASKQSSVQIPVTSRVRGTVPASDSLFPSTVVLSTASGGYHPKVQYPRTNIYSCRKPLGTSTLKPKPSAVSTESSFKRPNSYKQIVSQRKGYGAIAKEYLQSIGSKSSSVSTATTPSGRTFQ